MKQIATRDIRVCPHCNRTMRLSKILIEEHGITNGGFAYKIDDKPLVMYLLWCADCKAFFDVVSDLDGKIHVKESEYPNSIGKVEL